MKTDIDAAIAAAAPDKTAGLNSLQLITLRALVLSLVEPGTDRPDPLEAVLSSMSARAKAAGVTDADIEAELEAYNSERRS